ncbi:TetR/AcrR family transcriptional regulator [Actinoplanes sp. CA-054009]
MTNKTPGRRTDAVRNRERILSAAREAIDASDDEVSMAEIARRAGVGSATLYRNFPSRRDLLEALLAEEIDEVCAAASTVTGDTAAGRLTAWLRRFYDYLTGKNPVTVELLEHVDRDHPVFGTSRDRLVEAGTPLLSAARAAGEVTPAISLYQILDLVIAVAKIPGEPGYREPLLTTALAGLTQGGRELAA